MRLSKKASKNDIYIKGIIMAKFGLYTKGTNESNRHINIVDMPSSVQADAYFAGIKRLSLPEFKNLFVVREVSNNQNSKNLLLG